MPPGLSETPEEFEVKGRVTGRRLDAYLASRYPDFSRSIIQKVIDADAVLVNGKNVRASYKVQQGDQIRIWLPDIGDGTPTPEDIPISVLFEDSYFVVVDKPRGMIVHPAKGNWSGTLVNALQFHFDKLSTVGGEERPGVVHRLDKDTTGLVIVAKDDQSHKKLAYQFENRTIQKQYLALVYGEPSRDQDYIERPVGHHPTYREKMAIRSVEDGGKTAVTFYEVIERFRGYALVRCKPETGRTHQIRVHLTHIGHPIVSDKMYAGRDRLTLADLTGALPDSPEAGQIYIDRQALHAHRLRFTHPTTGEIISLEAPMPADFAAGLEGLRTYRKR